MTLLFHYNNRASFAITQLASFPGSHLEILVNILLTNGGLGLSLTHQVLQIVLKTFCVFQEAHGDVVIGVAVLQPREKGAAEKGKIINKEKIYKQNQYNLHHNYSKLTTRSK